jgi:hypothetical protein
MSCLVSSASVTAKFAAVKVVADMRKDENCMFDLHAPVCTENSVHLDLPICKRPLMVAGGPSSPREACPDCIVAACGYDSRDGQAM